MGSHHEHTVQQLWCTDPLFWVEPIAEIMRVKRFKNCESLRASDNSKAHKSGHVNFNCSTFG